MDFKDAQIEALQNRLEELNNVIVNICIELSEGFVSQNTIDKINLLCGNEEDKVASEIDLGRKEAQSVQEQKEVQSQEESCQ